jgi:hypothetical protein
MPSVFTHRRHFLPFLTFPILFLASNYIFRLDQWNKLIFFIEQELYTLYFKVSASNQV